MAQNKNALIRYKTIDQCLQNKYRKWTLEDLITTCSDALFEYEGRDVNVSKRTLQLDIQTMRSDKLGYNAPIEVYQRKYYRYSEDNYSITKIPVTENDINILTESVEVLKQFKEFSLFSELGGIIQKLEDKIYSEKTDTEPIIHLDKNENLKGLEYLDPLYQAILKKVCIIITYQSFRAREERVFSFHPYILKEFNNRWFLVGRRSNHSEILTLALDRIKNIDYDFKSTFTKKDFQGSKYYQNTIGVTVMPENHVKKIHLLFDSQNAPYVITKPFHSSQKIIQNYEDGSVKISINVHINFELERLILGFGKSVKVLKPGTLRRRIKNILKNAYSNYQN
jgi:predicted DNA-binding transcriptional regulator YafY